MLHCLPVCNMISSSSHDFRVLFCIFGCRELFVNLFIHSLILCLKLIFSTFLCIYIYANFKFVCTKTKNQLQRARQRQCYRNQNNVPLVLPLHFHNFTNSADCLLGTAVACKRSLSFHQKCRWQVTANHACTKHMWLWPLHEVTWCMVVWCTQNLLRQQHFHVALVSHVIAKQHRNSVSTPLQRIVKMHYKKKQMII